VDVDAQKAMAHELECMRAAYGALIERARQAGKMFNVRRLEAELRSAEREILAAFKQERGDA
jgi:hypothetical protein